MSKRNDKEFWKKLLKWFIIWHVALWIIDMSIKILCFLFKLIKNLIIIIVNRTNNGIFKCKARKKHNMSKVTRKSKYLKIRKTKVKKKKIKSIIIIVKMIGFFLAGLYYKFEIQILKGLGFSILVLTLVMFVYTTIIV